MKRQKVMSVKGFEAAEMAAKAKKKAKNEADFKVCKNEEDEEVKKKKEEKQVEGNVIDWASWDEDDVIWPWIWDFVDEQMSWGSVWIPFPDEAAFTALYCDVVWDDDIWDLKKEIPIPSNS